MPMIPMKASSVNLATGEETPIEGAQWFLAPPKADVCQTCAVDHPAEAPHNQQSLYYQMAFNGEHGRYPTWRDAMAHCAPTVQAMWIEELERLGVDVGPAPAAA